MKQSEKDSKFPVKPQNDIIREKVSKGERNLEDLSDKEKQLFIRIYEFTPKTKLCEKFAISPTTHDELVTKLKEDGNNMRKNASYSRSVVKADPKNPPAKNSETPDHLLASFMNSMNEEERREMMVMYEEGMDPVALMKQMIVIQSSRILRGYQLEKGSTQLHKTMNEATSDIATMISKLHEMEEGIKQVHGFDDSFLGIMLALQKRTPPK